MPPPPSERGVPPDGRKVRPGRMGSEQNGRRGEYCGPPSKKPGASSIRKGFPSRHFSKALYRDAGDPQYSPRR